MSSYLSDDNLSHQIDLQLRTELVDGNQFQWIRPNIDAYKRQANNLSTGTSLDKSSKASLRLSIQACCRRSCKAFLLLPALLMRAVRVLPSRAASTLAAAAFTASASVTSKTRGVNSPSRPPTSSKMSSASSCFRTLQDHNTPSQADDNSLKCFLAAQCARAPANSSSRNRAFRRRSGGALGNDEVA